MKKFPTSSLLANFSSSDFWQTLRNLLGANSTARAPLDSPKALGVFLNSRASHVAQTSLYGYIKTRAGMRFPVLFEDSAMLASINIAKWHVWLACLSDLAFYSGIVLCRETDASIARVRALLGQTIVEILAQVEIPADAGADFAAATEQVKQRIERADFAALTERDYDLVFCKSPAALVHWSPIADELKSRDVEIIRNSVRFRWQEVRRNLHQRLQGEALVRVFLEGEKKRKEC